MPHLSIFKSPGPYHILSYGTILGTQVFQSFIAGTTAYRVLTRPNFSTLQSALFPIYFSMQTTLPLVLALTFPSERTAIGRTLSSIPGVLEPAHRVSVLIPLSIMFLTGLANLAVVGPATNQTMKNRQRQEKEEGKDRNDPTRSDKMTELNKKFGQLHGISSLLNMASCIATVWYGFHLGQRLV